MDSVENPSSASAKSKSKFSRKFKKVKSATKALSNNGFCLLIPQDKLKNRYPKRSSSNPFENQESDEKEMKNRAAMDAFVAKLFSTIAVLKASYAELQIAQFPYNPESIESADQAVVNELKTLSEMKQSYLKKQIDSSPVHVTLLLCEIQEQQSLMKMYEIASKKLETEIDSKQTEISILETNLSEICAYNKSLEKKLNSSGSFSVLDCINFSNPNPKDFITVLNYTIRSIRSFLKILVQNMVTANWEIELAAHSIIPNLKFLNKTHVCFAFESFVCQEMFKNFTHTNFSLPNLPSPEGHKRRFLYIDRFKNLKSENPIKYLKRNKDSTFSKFVRAKYLCLVHQKMEASFSGNLNQRKMVNSYEFPETQLFISFAEMARRIYLLHCLSFSFEDQVEIFQVRKNSRFSEVYMESVTDEILLPGGSNLAAAFTVVPGFKIGKTVVQSQVYLSSPVS